MTTAPQTTASLNAFSFDTFIGDIWDTAKNTFTGVVNTAENYWTSLSLANQNLAQTQAAAATQAAYAGNQPAQTGNNNLVLYAALAGLAIVLIARK